MTTPNHGESSIQGTLAGLLACLIWSAAILVMNRLATAFQPLRAAGYELAIAGVFLLAVAWIRGEVSRIGLHSRLCHFVCGTFWILNLVFCWLGVGLVVNGEELVVVGLLNYLWPSFTLLLAIFILGKRATWWLLPGMAAVLSGVVLGKMATSPVLNVRALFSEMNGPAYTCATIGALAWGFYSNYSRKLSHPAGASAVPFYMLVASALLLSASAMLEVPAYPTLEQWVFLCIWSVATGLAYLAWDVGMRRGNVVTISTSSMLIPLVSTIITAVLSGVGLSVALVIASLLVVGGSALCRRGVV